MALISKETATDIALTYRELESAEKLLLGVREAVQQTSPKDLRDVFGRSVQGLQLGVPSGDNSTRLFNVPHSLAIPVIETHIAHHKAKLSTLSEKARIELAGSLSDLSNAQ